MHTIVTITPQHEKVFDNEILEQIFGYSSSRDLVKCRSVCKQWNQVLRQSSLGNFSQQKKKAWLEVESNGIKQDYSQKKEESPHQSLNKFTKGGTIIPCLVFILLALIDSFIILQFVTISKASSIPATILENQISEVHGRYGISYVISITFQYFIGDELYKGTQLYPVDFFPYPEEHNVHALKAMYSIGLKTTAYFDSSHPNKNFLIRKYNSYPYIFLLAVFYAINVFCLPILVLEFETRFESFLNSIFSFVFSSTTHQVFVEEWRQLLYPVNDCYPIHPNEIMKRKKIISFLLIIILNIIQCVVPTIHYLYWLSREETSDHSIIEKMFIAEIVFIFVFPSLSCMYYIRSQWNWKEAVIALEMRPYFIRNTVQTLFIHQRPSLRSHDCMVSSYTLKIYCHYSQFAGFTTDRNGAKTPVYKIFEVYRKTIPLISIPTEISKHTKPFLTAKAEIQLPSSCLPTIRRKKTKDGKCKWSSELILRYSDTSCFTTRFEDIPVK